MRLVIWDLDETFWGGTLSEGGIVWRPENAETVRELSRRGIINSICSKNDIAPVDAVLQQHGLREHFVFPSISWDAKGPRLAALVEAAQLRPETILFIDDNPMNRAEAKHFLPALQVEDETIVPRLLDDPRLRGKPDPDMKRLAQYQLLERRQADQRLAGGDTTAFLRESGITVSIDFDLEPHIDRAVELINRTNQLNFTKRRLPEDPHAAREALRALLARLNVHAGILRVRDRYGDYGYCGLYAVRNNRDLVHFVFSCRILGMGVESWLYQRLNRPSLQVVGDVLTDVVGDHRVIDWIATELPGVAGPAAEQQRELAYALVRGGCDMGALAHYFAMVCGRLVEELPIVRGGARPLICSSVVAAHAIHGVSPALIRDSAPLGFLPEDFTSLIADPPPDLPAVWVLSFALERGIPLLRHKTTRELIPAWTMGAHRLTAEMFQDDAALAGPDADVVAQLRPNFEMFGLASRDMFKDHLRLILQRIPTGVDAFILLANEQGRRPDGTPLVLVNPRARNVMIAEVARDYASVQLIKPADFMSADELGQLDNAHHYDRLVYFRIFQHIMGQIRSRRERQGAGTGARETVGLHA